MRTNVYVDGFNLYYGSLRNTKYRWLNLELLFQFLLPGHAIQDIKYYTALVRARPNNPSQPLRQQVYLRALSTLPKVSIHLGHFLVHEVNMPVVVKAGQAQHYVKVIKTEEKSSDVNLATHMLHDAHRDRFDVAVVVTNDSDLLEPIKIVRREIGKKVGLINPHKRFSHALLPHTDFIKSIRQGVLLNSQFEDCLSDAKGVFSKPSEW